MLQNKSGSTTAMPIWFTVITVIFLLARLFANFSQNTQQATGIDWKAPSLVAESKEGYEPEKPYLLEFSADWCGPCKQLNQKAFSNTQIISLINDKFIPVRVLDRQKEEGMNPPDVAILESKYHIYGFPTLVVALRNGTQVVQTTGVPSSYDIYEWLRSALKISDYTRGLSYMLDYKIQEALPCFQNALADPDWSASKTRYAAAFLAVGERLVHKKDAAGKRILDEALARDMPEHWPRPILKYLRGDITDKQLVQATDQDQDELTEAHCFIGLDLLAAGKRDEAIREFHWVIKEGNKEFQAFKLALTFLEHEAQVGN